MQRKCKGGNKFTISQEKINHVMYINDVKIFAKNEKQPETLIQTIIICDQDIRIQFGIEKFMRLIKKNEQRDTMEGIQLSNQESIRTIEVKENYKYIGILEADTTELTEKYEPWKRKLMTMHNVLHLRNDIDRLYVKRKEGGTGFAHIKDCKDVSI